MIPPEPGPDPPEPELPDNVWAYDSTTTKHNKTVYVGVDSANGAFAGVVCVGFDGNINWYSDGSLIYIDGSYYPYDVTNDRYYDYLNNRIMVWDDSKERFQVLYYSAIPFDQVPADFVSYLSSGDFTLNPAP